jgi:hypothetical protein
MKELGNNVRAFNQMSTNISMVISVFHFFSYGFPGVVEPESIVATKKQSCFGRVSVANCKQIHTVKGFTL